MPSAAKPRPGPGDIPARADAKPKPSEARSLSLADIAIAKAQAAHAETQAWEAALVLCEKESRAAAAQQEGRAAVPAPCGGEAARASREPSRVHERSCHRSETARGRPSRGPPRKGVAGAAQRAGRRGAGKSDRKPAAGGPAAASPRPGMDKPPQPGDGVGPAAERSRAEEEARLRASIHFPTRFPALQGAPRGTYRGQGASCGPSGSRGPTDGGRSPPAASTSSSSYSSSSGSLSTLSSSSTDSEGEADVKGHSRRAEPAPAGERPLARPKSGCEPAGRRRCRRRVRKLRGGKTRRGGGGWRGKAGPREQQAELEGVAHYGAQRSSSATDRRGQRPPEEVRGANTRDQRRGDAQVPQRARQAQEPANRQGTAAGRGPAGGRGDGWAEDPNERFRCEGHGPPRQRARSPAARRRSRSGHGQQPQGRRDAARRQADSRGSERRHGAPADHLAQRGRSSRRRASQAGHPTDMGCGQRQEKSAGLRGASERRRAPGGPSGPGQGTERQERRTSHPVRLAEAGAYPGAPWAKLGPKAGDTGRDPQHGRDSRRGAPRRHASCLGASGGHLSEADNGRGPVRPAAEQQRMATTDSCSSSSGPRRRVAPVFDAGMAGAAAAGAAEDSAPAKKKGGEGGRRQSPGRARPPVQDKTGRAGPEAPPEPANS